jgi:putative heme-binding domain-containing protein
MPRLEAAIVYSGELAPSAPDSLSGAQNVTDIVRRFVVAVFMLAVIAQGASSAARAADPLPARKLFRRDNLVAWCIVPFDDEARSPVDRAAMMKRLGIVKYAYDYRAEHVPQFDDEMKAIAAQGIELVGWWFPGELNDEAKLILGVLERHGMKPSLWVSGGGGPTANADEQKARVAAEAARLRPIAEAASKIGCTVGLYNHGGWFGEPENQIEIIESLRAGDAPVTNVGIVYNQHHGHVHAGRFRELLARMKPYLQVLNLNGMFADGEARGLKIAPIGTGEQDMELLKIVVESGFEGPFGILNHTQLDAEDRLRDNIVGLEWVAAKLDGKDPGALPGMKTWQAPAPVPKAASASPSGPMPHDPAVVAALAAAATGEGASAANGARVFTRQTLACVSCHKVGEHGGNVGPALSRVGVERTAAQIAESLLWPQHVVAPEFRTVTVVTADGASRRGYREREDEAVLVLRDPASGAREEIAKVDVDIVEESGSMMPDGLMQSLHPRDRSDLVRFLSDLGRHADLPAATVAAVVAAAHPTIPAAFEPDRAPLSPDAFPDWQLPVNRDRQYDFYAKEARWFRSICPTPPLLPQYPGLDGGKQGHWGNQNEETWRDGRWNDTILGSVQAGVLHAFGKSIVRGICVQLGEGLNVCFDPESFTYPVAWKGKFLVLSDTRYGFLGGLAPGGEEVMLPAEATQVPGGAIEYVGFVRQGERVGFLSDVDGVLMLDVPLVREGRFERVVGPVDTHPLKSLLDGGPAQWPEVIETNIVRGTQVPWAVDTFELPVDNPWKALLFCGDHDFLPDGKLVVCTMQGDVWRAEPIEPGADGEPRRLAWRRIASGLHHPLGMAVVDGVIHVLGRDQITKLVDTNGDGEADRYDCFSRAYTASAGGHDYTCGLVRDTDGRFITACSAQGLVRISADGKTAEVLATGLRNSDGVGICPDGTITAGSSEGDWVPASLVGAVPPGRPLQGEPPLHFGHKGPVSGRVPDLPLAYLPRGIDNNCGGQVWVPEGAMGPLGGQLVHLSFGAGTAMVLLRDEVAGQQQGAIVPLPVSFRSGSHRGKFNDRDGGLYVSGMAGWGTYTPADGCLERVRYTGRRLQQPTGFHLHDNGVRIDFAEPIDPAVAADPARHFAQVWNYRYGAGYGSDEYSTTHEGLRGHDHLPITAVQILAGGKSLFLEMPEIQPVDQLHLLVASAAGVEHDLVITANRLDGPLPGARERTLPLLPHPLFADTARALNTKPNPFAVPSKNVTAKIDVAVGANLSFVPRRLAVNAGDVVELTFTNPDSVPHNWALLRPGTLARVGGAVNGLVTDPEAAARQYLPETADVVAWTDITPPGEKAVIWFRVPDEPGRYPFLCSFPGHWMAMQGELIVAPAGGGGRTTK